MPVRIGKRACLICHNMKRRWWRPSMKESPLPVRTCHFCNQPSTLLPPHPAEENDVHIQVDGHCQPAVPDKQSPIHVSTGVPFKWYCSQCQCWNRQDIHEEGGIASWDPSMMDTGQSASNSIGGRVAKTRPSPFCHTCQTNQTLVLSMIANYEESERDNFAEWKSQLEDRYPPVCEECALKIDEQIHEADQNARRLIWHGWLQQRDRKPSHVSPSQYSHPDTSHLPFRSIHGTHLEGYSKGTWWLQALFFVLGWVTTIVVSVQDRGPPSIRTEALSHSTWCSPQVITSLCSAIVCHCVARRWEAVIRIPKGASKQKVIQVSGLDSWRNLHSRLLAARIAQVIALTFVRGTQSTLVSIAAIGYQIYDTIRTYRSLRVRSQPRVSLKSRQGIATPPRRRDTDISFDSLTLDHLGRKAMQDRGSHVENADRIVDGTLFATQGHCPSTEKKDDDQMDWSPTLPAQSSTTSWQFGPQRHFGPIRQTGLEDLLVSNMALDDGTDGAKDPHKTRCTSDNNLTRIWQVLGQASAAMLLFSGLSIAVLAVLLHTGLPAMYAFAARHAGLARAWWREAAIRHAAAGAGDGSMWRHAITQRFHVDAP